MDLRLNAAELFFKPEFVALLAILLNFQFNLFPRWSVRIFSSRPRSLDQLVAMLCRRWCSMRHFQSSELSTWFRCSSHHYYLNTIYLQTFTDSIGRYLSLHPKGNFYQLLFLMRLVHQGSPSHAALAQRLTDISLITLATLRLTSCWFTHHTWILKTFRTSVGRSCRRNVWTHGTASRSFESRERFGQSESLVCSQRMFFLSLFAYCMNLYEASQACFLSGCLPLLGFFQMSSASILWG